MNHLGPPQDGGLAFAARWSGRKREFHLLSPPHMRLCRLAQQRCQRCLPQMQVVLSRPAHATQDIAASVGLIPYQPGILQKLGVIAQLFHHLEVKQSSLRQALSLHNFSYGIKLLQTLAKLHSHRLDCAFSIFDGSDVVTSWINGDSGNLL